MRRASSLLLTLAALALPCAGCGSSAGSSPPPTLPVKGKVTYNGRPLIQGTVTFVPDRGPEANGNIQPDGSYSLTTRKDGDGAVAGVHQVAVDGATGKGASFRVPPKFRNVSSSKIEMEVKDGTTDYDINLK